MSQFSPTTSFTVTFRPRFLRRSFADEGTVIFSSDALVVTGDLVTKTFLPMLHFFLFFILITIGVVTFDGIGALVTTFMSIILGWMAFVYVQRSLKGVSQTIPYVFISELTVRGCIITLRQRQQDPEVISFHVKTADCQAVHRALMRWFPAAVVAGR